MSVNSSSESSSHLPPNEPPREDGQQAIPSGGPGPNLLDNSMSTSSSSDYSDYDESVADWDEDELPYDISSPVSSPPEPSLEQKI